jgi:hypothetical protein
MTQPNPNPPSPAARSQPPPANPAVPHWELRASAPGTLTAVLTGFAITVTAPDEATLRKRIRETIMRGML